MSMRIDNQCKQSNAVGDSPILIPPSLTLHHQSKSHNARKIAYLNNNVTTK